MIKFGGEHSMKVNVINKPIKEGFRAFALCESTSGYVLN